MEIENVEFDEVLQVFDLFYTSQSSIKNIIKKIYFLLSPNNRSVGGRGRVVLGAGFVLLCEPINHDEEQGDTKSSTPPQTTLTTTTTTHRLLSYFFSAQLPF